MVKENMFQITFHITWPWRKQASTALPGIGEGERVTFFSEYRVLSFFGR